MKYSPLLIVHICAGVVALFSGAGALVVRKGSRWHRTFGDAFVTSMLTMAAVGGSLALMKLQSLNIVAAAFTLYLVATAWLTVKRRESETGLAERGLLMMALAVGTGSLLFGWHATNSAGPGTGEPAAAFFVFGALAWLAAAGDARMLFRSGISGARRLARHLWRMHVALFIAAASFFLGMSGDPVLRRSGLRATLFPAAVRKTHLPEVPVILILILMIFWLCRVRLTKPRTQGKYHDQPERSVVAVTGLPQGAVR